MMPKFCVTLLRIDDYTVTVEADGEDEALEAAFEQAPSLCGYCAFGGAARAGGVAAGDWVTVEEFHGAAYDPKRHGATVTEVEDTP